MVPHRVFADESRPDLFVLPAEVALREGNVQAFGKNTANLEVSMTQGIVKACVPLDISEDDIYEAMKDISGYVDITPADCREIYLKGYQHAIARLAHSVKASDVMTRDVASVLEGTPIKDVAQIMAERRVSGVPVISSDDRVIGIISEKDFLANMAGRQAATFMEVVTQCLRGGACLAAPIRAKYAKDIMTSPSIIVNEQTPVLEVANMLTIKKINRVPVVDQDARMVGIISRADVVGSSLLLVGHELLG